MDIDGIIYHGLIWYIWIKIDYYMDMDITIY